MCGSFTTNLLLTIIKCCSNSKIKHFIMFRALGRVPILKEERIMFIVIFALTCLHRHVKV